MHEVKEIEGHDSCDDLQILRYGFEGFDEKGLFMTVDSDATRKRKDVDHGDQDSSDGATAKKARVVWSVDLHQKFVNAVNQIGFDSECSLKYQLPSYIFISYLPINLSNEHDPHSKRANVVILQKWGRRKYWT